VSFVFHEVGKTTKELGLMCEGACIDNINGPLGNPSEIKKFGKVLCVGGSVMIAPLLLQSKAMREAGNSVTTGHRCERKRLLDDGERGQSLKQRLLCCYCDGSKGFKAWIS